MASAVFRGLSLKDHTLVDKNWFKGYGCKKYILDGTNVEFGKVDP
jgi:hypothetical protein